MKKKEDCPNRKKLVQKLDVVFSKYIRLIESDQHGNVTCPLCGKVMHRKQAQCMHFIKRSVYKYRRDEKNCHAGCMRCNVILHGNYIIYTRRMQRKYGELLVDQMINDKQLARISTAQIQELIVRYEELVQDLKEDKGL